LNREPDGAWLLMLQGANDNIFPCPPRGLPAKPPRPYSAPSVWQKSARFDTFPNEPHGLSKPFREAMYGWMHCTRRKRRRSSPPEGDVAELPTSDRRLYCDSDGRFSKAPRRWWISRAAKAQAMAQDRRVIPETRTAFLKALVTDHEPQIERQLSRSSDLQTTPGGAREKVVFLSEIGEYIPAILWKPNRPSASVILIADSRGKSAVAQSNLIAPLLREGYAIFAVDLRGRGETLGQRLGGRDSNYHFVSHSIMWVSRWPAARSLTLRAPSITSLRATTCLATVLPLWESVTTPCRSCLLLPWTAVFADRLRRLRPRFLSQMIPAPIKPQTSSRSGIPAS
jgi:hypothetical protein